MHNHVSRAKARTALVATVAAAALAIAALAALAAPAHHISRPTAREAAARIAAGDRSLRTRVQREFAVFRRPVARASDVGGVARLARGGVILARRNRLGSVYVWFQAARPMVADRASRASATGSVEEIACVTWSSATYGGWASGCGDAHELANGNIGFSELKNGKTGAASGVVVTGLVPNGVSSVTIRSGSGDVKSVPVVNNAVLVEASNASTVEYTLPDGRVQVDRAP